MNSVPLILLAFDDVPAETRVHRRAALRHALAAGGFELSDDGLETPGYLPSLLRVRPPDVLRLAARAGSP